LSVSTVSGGGGIDTLGMSAAGAIRLTGVSGIEKLRLSGGSKNRLTLTNSNFLHVADNVITVFAGGDGNTVDASALSSGNRVVVAGGAGADVLTGGAGNDSFSVSRAVLAHAGTRITGGGGRDTLVLTDSGAVTTVGISGIGTIRLASTGNNSLTLRDANFTGMGAGVISVQGGDSGNNITEATVSAGLRAILIGGANADTIVAGREATMTGGSGADLFVLTTPGSAKTPDKNTITDFAAASDRLAFSSAGFGLGIAGAGAAPKQLPAGLFSPEPNGTFTSSTERFAYDRSNGALYFDADGIVPANSPMRIATIANHAALGAANLLFVA
jgi:Ca2+-binding RTX toxin-like protein